MSEDKDNSEPKLEASCLYGTREFSCSVIYNENLVRLATRFPITKVLPEPGVEYIPTFSHPRDPDEGFRFGRLLDVHRIMTIVLDTLSQLSIYERVLAMHDRKGTLILVIENATDLNDLKLLIHAACIGWSAVNECEVAITYRYVGQRPRVPASMMPPPRKAVKVPAPPATTATFTPAGIWWVTAPNGVGGGFVPD